MNNDPNQPQWEQPSQPQWQQQQPPPQYDGQAQWAQPQSPPQWGQPSTQYSPPQQYGANQYQQYGSVPPYAQVQPQQQQTNNFFMRWLMMGLAVRIAILIILPLVLCGGCAMLVFFASLAHP
jgi:hypothetical protein